MDTHKEDKSDKVGGGGGGGGVTDRPTAETKETTSVAVVAVVGGGGDDDNNNNNNKRRRRDNEQEEEEEEEEEAEEEAEEAEEGAAAAAALESKPRAVVETREETGMASGGTRSSFGGEVTMTAKAGSSTLANPTSVRPPIKKARTAYFIFADEKRAQVQAMHPGEGITAISKATGQLWALLSAEEKEKYQNLAAKERERVGKDLQAFGQVGEWGRTTATASASATTPTTTTTTTTTTTSTLSPFCLPVARIRKICKLDPEVRGISREASVLLTRATELFGVLLGQEAVHVAQVQNRRKLLPQDVAHVCGTKEEFVFLRHDVGDYWMQQQQRQRQRQRQQGSTTTTHKPTTTTKAEARAAEGSKPLTTFFGTLRKGT